MVVRQSSDQWKTAGFSELFCTVPKNVPQRSLRSSVLELRKLFLIRGLRRRRRFFRNTPPKFASTKKIHRICKCLRGVYLQTCGEVAEWPKAAVC